MTARTLRRLVIDFSRFDCAQANERVRQLVSMGLSEALVASLVGWDLNSVRRACAERSAPVVGFGPGGVLPRFTPRRSDPW
jgi:hypothetical protein